MLKSCPFRSSNISVKLELKGPNDDFPLFFAERRGHTGTRLISVCVYGCVCPLFISSLFSLISSLIHTHMTLTLTESRPKLLFIQTQEALRQSTANSFRSDNNTASCQLRHPHIHTLFYINTKASQGFHPHYDPAYRVDSFLLLLDNWCRPDVANFIYHRPLRDSNQSPDCHLCYSYQNSGPRHSRL